MLQLNGPPILSIYWIKTCVENLTVILNLDFYLTTCDYYSDFVAFVKINSSVNKLQFIVYTVSIDRTVISTSPGWRFEQFANDKDTNFLSVFSSLLYESVASSIWNSSDVELRTAQYHLSSCTGCFTGSSMEQATVGKDSLVISYWKRRKMFRD